MLLKKICFVLSLVAVAAAIDDPQKQKDKSTRLPPCKACTVLAESFNLGLERTKRGKHAGGDAAWEQEKLRSYRTSEVRFVEIQEQLCADVKRGQDHCHSLSNDHESLIEDWFTHKQEEEPDLHVWLCIKELSVCCPRDTYGPLCEPCIDCMGNGKCKGNGTRKGNGQCLCDAGYSGNNCNECDEEHFESFRDATKLLCTHCHAACGEGGCNGAGPKNCRKCKDGWSMDTERGCVDINECVEQRGACPIDKFCVNNEGSFTCLECDRSCDGCHGDGPDMCQNCGDGYRLIDGKCQDVSAQQRESQMNITRLLTYFGMCVATCVIFQSSTHIAYIVGGAVAIYIAASEYWLSSTAQGALKPEIDTKRLEDLIMKSL